MKPTLAALAALHFLTGCSVAEAPPAATPTVATAPAVPILDRSLFGKDSAGSLSEDALQKLLATPIDLQLPARVGVVPLAAPFDPAAEVTVATRSVAAQRLAKALAKKNPHFSHVSDISTDLPNVGGLEGLRTLAARYRLRYLLLYSERFDDDTHVNGWAFLYPTIVGIFVAPAVTVESHGLAQVDLLDVRTGVVLFSVVEPMEVQSDQLLVNADRNHRRKQGEQAGEAALRLAARVSEQTEALVAFAEKAQREVDERRTLIVPAPIKPE